TPEDDRARVAIEHALRFECGREAIDRRFVYSVAEDVDRVTVFVESLHDAHRAAIDRRAEKTSHGRVAHVFDGRSERREISLVVTSESRIEILEPDELLQTARAQTHRAVPQPVHQVYVADFKQAQRAGVS